MTADNTKGDALPSFAQAAAAAQAGRASALESFIYENEPAGEKDSAWRDALAAVINEETKRVLTVRDAIGQPRLSRDRRQRAVVDWCAAAFGVAEASYLPQRALRFLEEAVELYQAAGGHPAQAHKLISFVFGREPGTIHQELGGVGVTLLALAEVAGVSADEAERMEMNRVLALPLDHFAARNKAKNDAGFLAEPVPEPGSIIELPEDARITFFPNMPAFMEAIGAVEDMLRKAPIIKRGGNFATLPPSKVEEALDLLAAAKVLATDTGANTAAALVRAEIATGEIG